MKIGLILFAFVAAVCGIILFVSWSHASPTPISYPIDIPAASSTPSPAASTTSALPSPPAITTLPVSHASAFKATETTYFFVGEPSDASNDFIPNDVSYWDDAWQKHFGGADSDQCREGYNPCGFTPKENPFYVALPYAEFDASGALKESAKTIPWYQPGLSPLLKNHWVEVRYNSHTCYGQWEDVGPNGEDDFAYVFGSAKYPVNTFGERAGLDVSPAMFSCLGLTDNATTSWRFVDPTDVPSGPWKSVVTSSPISWGN